MIFRWRLFLFLLILIFILYPLSLYLNRKSNDLLTWWYYSHHKKEILIKSNNYFERNKKWKGTKKKNILGTFINGRPSSFCTKTEKRCFIDTIFPYFLTIGLYSNNKNEYPSVSFFSFSSFSPAPNFEKKLLEYQKKQFNLLNATWEKESKSFKIDLTETKF